ncbi:hypothetical protein [Mastigocladopsis repens]|uniref:hypothetical protein n=1 Tax=Mastigocladopsis repens TaxID=221287 RepID=UPI0002D529C3|nr:hypothetical protein [Mastigocladopsis repens]
MLERQQSCDRVLHTVGDQLRCTEGDRTSGFPLELRDFQKIKHPRKYNYNHYERRVNYFYLDDIDNLDEIGGVEIKFS